MQILINSCIVFFMLIVMEAFSWTIHKYLFHGPLWFIHKSHHQKRSGWFEFNDIFSLIFGSIAMLLMWQDRLELNTSFWVGTGISLYGIIYFIFHDWFIHNRLKSFKTSNSYLLNIRKAHKIHHKTMQKNPSQEFGLLLVSKKYVKKSPNL